jgi:hypothetical protein
MCSLGGRDVCGLDLGPAVCTYSALLALLFYFLLFFTAINLLCFQARFGLLCEALTSVAENMATIKKMNTLKLYKSWGPAAVI